MTHDTLAARIASLVQARKNCESSNNSEWFAKHTEALRKIERNELPRGSGVDHGTTIDLDASTIDKIVLNTSFHHMNENGFYDGWTEHKVIATPAFQGVNLKITGRDRNGIKEYLGDLFYTALTDRAQSQPTN